MKNFLTLALLFCATLLQAQYDYDWFVSNTSSNPGERVVAVIDAGSIGTFTGIELVGEVIDNNSNWGDAMPSLANFTAYIKFSNGHQYGIYQDRETQKIILRLRKVSDTVFHLTANCTWSHKAVRVRFNKVEGSPTVTLGSVSAINTTGTLVVSQPTYRSTRTGTLYMNGLPDQAGIVMAKESFIGFRRADNALVYGMGHQNGHFVVGASSNLGPTAGTWMKIATGGNRIIFQQGSSESMRITDNGSLAIGTTSTGSHKLAVDGSIGARKVQVEATGWSDFVFEPGYPLMDLEQLSRYIKEEKHLPEIPSEKEVLEGGIDVAEMDAKLLQKIEELTLYVIEINRELQQLKKENEALRKKEK